VLHVLDEAVDDDSAHDPEALKVPPAAPSLKVTLPLGKEPATVAVHVVDEPTTIVEGLQLTEVTVGTST
jgi:hypothetical protein